ncbi:hypothetical protein JYU34_021231 [Plutella xylostella]|uniref:CBF1-interacting co-repressor CIR N-terminal domain-containing protein n=1 Tax=Plutella xylostella TaxID=51655 RepID=A0ABQ7PTM7_PLUXY|nr:hypothetical protein JYU34_021231 [Plutella xylostella]
MNILPKKRWHVRTKENIARVRKDEAEAAEKEKQEQQRIHNADREARLNVLKNKSKQKLLESGISTSEPEQPPEPSGHINLFSNFENAVQTTNKEHDKEAKEQKEEYEKKIGYLTYLGQDTNEALKKKNWYEILPESSRFLRSNDVKETYDKLVLKDADGKPKPKDLDIKNGEVSWNAKQRLDPINAFKEYCTGSKYSKHGATSSVSKTKAKTYTKDKSKKKSKSNKNRQDEKQMKLQKLREARLKREQQEKFKTERFLAGLHGSTSKQQEPSTAVPKVKPKYNSQFNPELARQNYM